MTMLRPLINLKINGTRTLSRCGHNVDNFEAPKQDMRILDEQLITNG